MRKIAGYVLFSGVLDGDDVRARFEAVSQLVAEWLATKGAMRDAEGTRELVLADGRVATYSCTSWTSGEGTGTRDALLNGCTTREMLKATLPSTHAA